MYTSTKRWTAGRKHILRLQVQCSKFFLTPQKLVQDLIIYLFHNFCQGYTIPEDSVIFINVKTIFMNKEHWGDPEKFRPERFLTDEGKIKKDEWLIPFGKGELRT